MIQEIGRDIPITRGQIAGLPSENLTAIKLNFWQKTQDSLRLSGISAITDETFVTACGED